MPTVTGGGFSPVLVATRKLTDAQIKALPTTPVVIITAPGAGAVIVPIHAVLRLAWTADYTGIDVGSGLTIEVGTSRALSALEEATPTCSVSGLLAGGDNSLALMSADAYAPPSAVATPVLGESGFFDSDLANLPLQITSSNALAFTGGNAANTLKVTVLYYVVTF